ncbi:MAG: hypothetical protein ACI8R4_004216 [Paracoccaceae bacterium]|jgi:hypothetical protein
MTKSKQSGALKCHHFPPDVITYAVWAYFRFAMSLRDVEVLLAERGVIVSYETIRAWVVKLGGQYARTIRRDRPARSDKWRSYGAALRTLAPRGRIDRRDGERRSWVRSNHPAMHNVFLPSMTKCKPYFVPAVTSFLPSPDAAPDQTLTLFGPTSHASWMPSEIRIGVKLNSVVTT